MEPQISQRELESLLAKASLMMSSMIQAVNAVVPATSSRQKMANA